MKALTHGPGGMRSPEIRHAALVAVRGVERGQHEIDSVFDWVKDNIEFRGEYGETLQEPVWTLRWRARRLRRSSNADRGAARLSGI